MYYITRYYGSFNHSLNIVLSHSCNFMIPYRSLQLFALVHVALGEPLNLHWLHKVINLPHNIFSPKYASSIHVVYIDECPICTLLFFYTDLLIFWRDIHRFWSHRNLPQVAKRMADCSSVTAGTVRLSCQGLTCFWERC